MARRVVRFKVEAEGRDQGKTFIITEMPATAGEWWGIRALMALSRGSNDLGFDPATAGLYELAVLGLRGLPYAVPSEIQPLLDEMMACVTIQPDASRDVTRSLIEDDIEEIKTRLDIREEWLKLHMGFLAPGVN